MFGKVAGDGMTYTDSMVSKLIIRNLNPDANDNGTREVGPFYSSNPNVPANTDGAPIYISGSSFTVPIILNAEQIDYLGPGITTTVPESGLIFTARNAVIDTGTAFTGTGPLGVGAGRNLQIREGVSLGRDLVNHGTISPGLELGVIAAQNYFQFARGTLAIDIAGPTVSDDYDRLVALGCRFHCR